jgi:hypothetical protein
MTSREQKNLVQRDGEDNTKSCVCVRVCVCVLREKEIEGLTFPCKNRAVEGGKSY